jgi:gamma-glutamylcyclotransferase (GGCT)/AIG2-like uncharacterized protein YtfP
MDTVINLEVVTDLAASYIGALRCYAALFRKHDEALTKIDELEARNAELKKQLLMAAYGGKAAI